MKIKKIQDEMASVKHTIVIRTFWKKFLKRFVFSFENLKNKIHLKNTERDFYVENFSIPKFYH